MSALLPCPFCGNRAILHSHAVATVPTVWTVSCDRSQPGWCGAEIVEKPNAAGAFTAEAEAIAAWNRRVTNKVGLALSALQEVREYLSERAEGEYHTDSAPTGNEEMRLLVEVEAAIAQATAAKVS